MQRVEVARLAAERLLERPLGAGEVVRVAGFPRALEEVEPDPRQLAGTRLCARLGGGIAGEHAAEEQREGRGDRGSGSDQKSRAHDSRRAWRAHRR